MIAFLIFLTALLVWLNVRLFMNINNRQADANEEKWKMLNGACKLQVALLLPRMPNL